jgi:cyclic pyranopterin phosphate synthase
MLKTNIKLSVNMVVMNGKNTEHIMPMAMLTKHDSVVIRFIEEMPFNGTGKREEVGFNHQAILETLREGLPELNELPFLNGTTAQEYSINGHQGRVGIIAAWTRNFCSSCNRIRVSATGEMKNCLYDKGVLNIKKMLNEGASDQMIADAIQLGYSKKYKNGLVAEANRADILTESMSSIGG